MKFLKLAFTYKKNDTFRYVLLLYTKIQILLKKQDSLRYAYIYTKILTLCVTQVFMEFLKLAEGGGGVILKNNALCVKPLYLKKNVWLHLYIYIYALCITFITICFGIVLIPNYKRTYNQSNQIDKNI